MDPNRQTAIAAVSVDPIKKADIPSDPVARLTGTERKCLNECTGFLNQRLQSEFGIVEPTTALWIEPNEIPLPDDPGSRLRVKAVLLARFKEAGWSIEVQSDYQGTAWKFT